MEKHITILGALYIAFGIIGLLLALVAFVAIVGGGAIAGDAQVLAITGTVGSVVALIILALSIPDLIAGIGLLQRKPWGRVFGLILGCLNLFNIPFGTILGIYTIWALLKDETVPLFETGRVQVT